MSSSTNKPPRARTGCQNCRLRHLKCDEQRPACTRCGKAGIECVRGYNVRFRHGANPSVAGGKGADYDFSNSQQWVNTSRELVYLDETRELMNFYDHDIDDEHAPATTLGREKRVSNQQLTPESNGRSIELPTAPRPSYDRSGSASLLEHAEIGSPAKRRRLTSNAFYQPSPTSAPATVSNLSPAASWHPSPHTGWTPTESIQEPLDFDSSFTGFDPPEHSAFSTIPNPSSQIYLDRPIWPLSNREEARLLRNYVDNLARNFDLTDPLRHFRTVVPQRAATCPPLLNALFALSARHLSRIGEYDPLVSNKYHQECLKHLIPMLDDSAAILDENLLASTIILRHLEEIEVPLSGQSPSDQQSHLLGAHAFIAAQERATAAGGLRQAAFWVGLRQEIYVAFVNQRSIIPALEHCTIDRSLEPASDDVWACRMVVLCADVLRHCFGSDGGGSGDRSSATYLALVDAVRRWHESKPPSFQPIYQRQADDEHLFPDLWFLGDEILIGLQHYHVARILLAAHNPRIPRLGPGRAAALKAMDEEIKDHVLMLCGMCLSNPEPPPNFVYASMAVTMAGDRFVERREQEALLGLLDRCERLHAWPTGHARENLIAAWGWDESG